MSDPALPPGFVEVPQAAAGGGGGAPPLPPGFTEVGNGGASGSFSEPSLMDRIGTAVKPYAKALGRGAVSGMEGMTKLGIAASYATPGGLIDMATNDNLPFTRDESGLHFRNPLDKDPIRRRLWEGADEVERTTNEAIPNIKGEGNDYGKSIAEGVGGALATPAGGLGKSVVMGAAGGLGGELGEQVTKSPLGRIGGTILGTVAGGLGSFFRGAEKTSAVYRAREALKGIPDEKLQEAQSFMEAASRKNVQLDPAQALTAVGADSAGVTALRNYLLGTDSGRKLQDMLKQQPGQLLLMKEAAIGAMPGEVKAASEAGRQLGSAADARVGMDKAVVEQTAAEFRDKARSALEATAKMKVGDAKQIVEGTNLTLAEARKKLMQLEGEIAGKKESYAGNQWLRNIPENMQDLADKVSAHAAKTAEIPTLEKGVASAEKGLDVAKRDAGRMLQDKGPQQGYDRIVKAGSTELEATNSGPVGKIAQGYSPNKPADTALTKFDALLEAGTSPQSKVSDIRQLGVELAKTPGGKQAYADGLKTALDKRYLKAFDEAPGPAGPTTTADTIKRVQQVLGDSAQEQGLKDALSLVAQQAGKDPNSAVKGYEVFRQVVKAMANRKEIPGASPEAITAGARKNLLSAGADVVSTHPLSGVSRAAGDFNARKVMERFSTVMTSPDGIDMLQRLAKSRPPEWAAIIQGAIGVNRDLENAYHVDINGTSKDEGR